MAHPELVMSSGNGSIGKVAMAVHRNQENAHAE
jgi:hypothetical protein